MNATQIPIITELDAARIQEMGARLPGHGEGLAALNELIAKVTHEAEIVPGRKIAPNIVTLNSIVSFRDELTGAVHKVAVVFPADMSIAERRISVLSPVGRALLGQSVGGIAKVELPDGTLREIRVTELHCQPESEGDFTR